MELWERQDGEGASAFHAFAHYRDMGYERSLDKAYRQHETDCQRRDVGRRRASGRWTRWYTCHAWRARAVALDAHNDRQRVEQLTRDYLARLSKSSNRAANRC